MNKVTTKTGFEFQVESDAMDDLEVFEAIRNANNPDISAMDRTAAVFEAFRHIVGEEQDKALREHLKATNGKLRTSEYKAEIEDFFANFNKKK